MTDQQQRTETDQCGASTHDGSACQNPPGDNGRCHIPSHNPDGEGGNPGGAPEANQNATTHGAYATPEYLQPHFSEADQDRYTAWFEALCTRYERHHGFEPDEFAKGRLQRVAIECVKERLADQVLAQNAEGNLMLERGLMDTRDGVVEVEQPSRMLKELTALKRETRLTLKDMGLLNDPETQKGQAAMSLAEALSRDD